VIQPSHRPSLASLYEVEDRDLASVLEPVDLWMNHPRNLDDANRTERLRCGRCAQILRQYQMRAVVQSDGCNFRWLDTSPVDCDSTIPSGAEPDGLQVHSRRRRLNELQKSPIPTSLPVSSALAVWSESRCLRELRGQIIHERANCRKKSVTIWHERCHG
jgi:hypothetical protein